MESVTPERLVAHVLRIVDARWAIVASSIAVNPIAVMVFAIPSRARTAAVAVRTAHAGLAVIVFLVSAGSESVAMGCVTPFTAKTAATVRLIAIAVITRPVRRVFVWMRRSDFYYASTESSNSSLWERVRRQARLRNRASSNRCPIRTFSNPFGSTSRQTR